MEPTAGLMDHVTAVFEEPVTVAVNCWVPDAGSVVLDGESVTVTTDWRVTMEEANTDELAALVAVTVTVCAALTELGAV